VNKLWNPDTIAIGLSKGGLTKHCWYAMLLGEEDMKIEIKQLTCTRCGYKWYPRSPEVIICPKCKSPYWDKKKVRTTKTVNVKKDGKNAVEVTYVPDEGSNGG